MTKTEMEVLFYSIKNVLHLANHTYFQSLYINGHEIENFDHRVRLVPKNNKVEWFCEDDKIYIDSYIDVYYSGKVFEARKVLLDFSGDLVLKACNMWDVEVMPYE